MKKTLSTHSPHLLEEIDYEKNKEFNPNSVGYSSTTKIWWKCNNGHSYFTSIGSRTRGKGTGCPICANQKILKGYNDLKTKFPDIAKDWDDEKNYPIKSEDVFPGTSKKYYWKCKNNHSYYKSPASRTNLKTGCPICANKEVLKGYNDIATTNPKVLEQWNYEKNNELGIHPDNVTKVSGKKVWWKCKKGHEWLATIAHITYGRGCPICNTGKQTSFPEQTIYFYINKIDSECRNRYKVNGKKELDIYIPSLKIGIEYDGYKWHEKEEKIIQDIEKEDYWKSLDVKIIRIKEQNKRNSQLSDGDWLKLNENEYYLNDEDYIALADVIKDIIFNLYKIDINVDIEKDSKEIYNNYLFVEEKDSLFNNKKIIKYYDYEKNKNLNPKYITKSSGKRVWWKCDKGHSYQTTVHSMDNGMYCPLCREELIKKGGLIPLDDKYIKTLKFSDEIKSLALEFPDIAKEWNYEKNYPVKPENIVSKSHKKFWWICSKCGYEWQTTPLVRVSGRGCKKCGYKSASQKMYKPVLQFDKEGKFIKEYESIDSAIKETGVLHISCVCRGERKTAGGYIWKYK